MFEDRLLSSAQKFQTILTVRWLPVLVTCLALVLAWGALSTGLQFDDYVHCVKILHPDMLPDIQNPITELFDFADGNSQKNEYKIKKGLFPWWTFAELKISFFRPLAALTHLLDYHYLPASRELADVQKSSKMMHIHSLVWFAAMVFAAALLYRRIITPLWIAGLAGLLFAIDDAHGIPAAWLANRNGLMAAAFGFSALYFHDRWRRDAWKGGAFIAPLLLLLSLFSAEAGIAVCGYLLSYELFLVSGNWKKKAVGLLPYFLLAVLWFKIYNTLGCGTYGSGLYIDPGRTPLVFLKHLFERLPVLLFGQWSVPDALFYGYLPKPQAYIALILIYIALGFITLFLLPVIKHNTVARFWTLGMLLSLFPISATVPSDRLLIFTGLGAMGLLALSLASWFEKKRWLPASRIWRVLAAILAVELILVHLIWSPFAFTRKIQSMKNYTEKTIEAPVSKLAKFTPFSKKTLIFINPPVPFAVAFIPFFCEKYMLPVPEKVYILASGFSPHITIERRDDASLIMTPENGFIVNDYDRLYRDTEHPMHVGQKVEMENMQAEVLSLTADDRPLRVRFTFSHPLGHESLIFLAWENDEFVPFKLPEKGKEVSLDLKVTPKVFGM